MALLAEAGKGIPCLFQRLTGLYCPGCGATRALRALLKGRLLQSLLYHPLVLYLAVMGTAWLGSRLLAWAAKNPRLRLGHELFYIALGTALVLANWCVKNYMLIMRGIDLLDQRLC